MARSDYIYVVLSSRYLGRIDVRAAFTVKRELVDWLNRQLQEDTDFFRVYRLGDNSDARLAADITDEVCW